MSMYQYMPSYLCYLYFPCVIYLDFHGIHAPLPWCTNLWFKFGSMTTPLMLANTTLQRLQWHAYKLMVKNLAQWPHGQTTRPHGHKHNTATPSMACLHVILQGILDRLCKHKAHHLRINLWPLGHLISLTNTLYRPMGGMDWPITQLVLEHIHYRWP